MARRAAAGFLLICIAHLLAGPMVADDPDTTSFSSGRSHAMNAGMGV